MTVQELALKTLAEIDRRGWIKESFYDRSVNNAPRDGRGVELQTCRVCTAGAIRAASNGAPDLAIIDTLGRELVNTLADRIRPEWESEGKWPDGENVVYSWNDDPETTIDDVRALLLQVAAS